MRELVTIREIADIIPIPDADAIEVAVVDGWKVVVKKSEFKVGDKAVYMEVDSFLPEEPRYEFLRKSSFRTDALGKTGFRLKTIKLRGQVSQGLLLPMSQFPELSNGIGWDCDKDLATFLHVTKWEPPIPAELAGEAYGPLPSVIKYTDQERIQNLPDYWEKYSYVWFEASIKIDGSSTTFYLLDGHFGVCGHNWEYRESEGNSQWRVARMCKVEEALRAYGKNIALQGEIYGEGIQKNPEKIRGQKVAIFDIWSIDESRYLTASERGIAMACLKDLGMTLEHVPVLGLKQPFQEYPTMEAILAAADGPSMNPNVKREGIVYKSAALINGQTVSFKTLSNKYLLSEKD